MEITTELIKQLRDETGISVMQCKKALEQSAGDMDAARALLRAPGPRLPNCARAAADDRLCAAQRHQRRALHPSRPGELPQHAHLPAARGAAEGFEPLSLCPQPGRGRVPRAERKPGRAQPRLRDRRRALEDLSQVQRRPLPRRCARAVVQALRREPLPPPALGDGAARRLEPTRHLRRAARRIHAAEPARQRARRARARVRRRQPLPQAPRRPAGHRRARARRP